MVHSHISLVRKKFRLKCELYKMNATIFVHRAGFATYLVSILLFLFIIRWGAYYMLTTGLLMMFACATYGIVIINDPPLQIRFGDDTLKPTFRPSFFLVLFTGFGTSVLAVLIVIGDYMWPRKVAKIFHHSIIEDDVIFQVKFTVVTINYWL